MYFYKKLINFNNYLQFLLFLFPLFAVFLLTVGHDEAWLIQSIRNIVDHRTYASGGFYGPLTTGGIYSIAQLLIAYLLPHKIWFSRLFTFISLVLLYLEVLKHNKAILQDRDARILSTASFFIIPGGLVLTSQAFGFVPALLFSIYGVKLWNSGLNGNYSNIIFAGITIGISVATRINFVVLFPGILIWVVINRERRKRHLFYSIVVILIAVIVVMLSVLLLLKFSPDKNMLYIETVADSGLNVFTFDYVRVFNKWYVLNDNLPISVMLIISICSFIFVEKENHTKVVEWKILLIFGWLMIIAWLFYSPIPHLRYIWPSLFIIIIYGGTLLGRLFIWAKDNNYISIIKLTVFISYTLLITGSIFAFIQIANGNSDLLSFQWSRETELLRFRRFDHIKNQNIFAKYIKDNVDEDEVIGVLFSSVTMNLLTNRECIGPIEWNKGNYNKDKLPKKIIIDPLIGSYLLPKPKEFAYLLEISELVNKQGDYLLLNIKVNNPDYNKIFSSLSRGQQNIEDYYQKE